MLKKLSIFIFLSILSMTGSVSACEEHRLARFFDGAEIQAENDQQRAVILDALHDALSLPVAELKQQRYPDYTGKAKQWDFLAVVEHYFVPAKQDEKPEANFYETVKTKEVQKKILKLVERLEPVESAE